MNFAGGPGRIDLAPVLLYDLADVAASRALLVGLIRFLYLLLRRAFRIRHA